SVVSDICNFHHQVRGEGVLNPQRPTFRVRISLIGRKEDDVLAIERGQCCRRASGLKECAAWKWIAQGCVWQKEIGRRDERSGLTESELSKNRGTLIGSYWIQVSHRQRLNENAEPASHHSFALKKIRARGEAETRADDVRRVLPDSAIIS